MNKLASSGVGRASAVHISLRPAGRVPREDRQRRAAQQAVAVDRTRLALGVGDTTVVLDVPPLDRLGFYADLTAAATVGLVEWPVAALTAVGHALSHTRCVRGAV